MQKVEKEKSHGDQGHLLQPVRPDTYTVHSML